jgi:hypothetical protein
MKRLARFGAVIDARAVLTALDLPPAQRMHAYGRADDTARLLGLLGTEAERADAMQYLHGSILHQGTIVPATPAIAEALVTVLPAPELAPARPAVIAFLGAVAQSAVDNDWAQDVEVDPGDEQRVAALIAADDLEPLYSGEVAMDYVAAAPVQQVLRAAPRWYDTITAADAAIGLLAASALPLDAVRAADLADRCNRALASSDRAVRIAAAHALGAARLLDDADPSVRYVVALRVSLADGPSRARAAAEVLAALRDPSVLDAGFPDPSPFPGWASLAAAQWAASGPPVEPRALADAGVGMAWRFPRFQGQVWAAFLAPLFRDRAEVLTSPQREVLGELLAIDELWDPRDGNNNLARKTLGLPADRAACAALLDG